ncbi:hypothetical protein AC579_1346 [Pseudocercospora musae]|uniref:ABC transporter domain-containing protein n=1 Tax=Pseudocercospora musae TaxID=113226 RepID=A0A139IP48_9PEZI|nr:hypothetical protein AC579_1346 [Pseudocercospora musae]
MTVQSVTTAPLQRSIVKEVQKNGVLRRITTDDYEILSFAKNADVFYLCIAATGSMLQGALMPVMTLVFGTLAGKFTDITNGTISEQEFRHSLAKSTLYFVYLAFGELVGSYAMWIGFTLAGENITNRIRRHLLTSLFQKGVAFIDQSDTGEITTLISADADAVKDALSSKLGRVIAAFTSVVVAFFIAFSRSWRLTLIMGSGLLAFAAAGGGGAYFISKFTQQSLAAQSEAASIAQEGISGITCVVANSAQTLLMQKYRACLARSQRPGILARISGEMMIAVITSIATCLFSLAFWRGSRYYVNGQASFADVLIVLLAVLLGTASLGLVGPNAQAVAAGLTAGKRIFAMVARTVPIDSLSETGIQPDRVDGRIRFKNVDFAYPTRPNVKVLSEFNLTIPAKKTTAIVGASGCGKSTIAKLIQRYFDPYAGLVSLDDRVLSTLSLKWLRRQISVVSQEPDLFNASIYDNIRYGLTRSGEGFSNAEMRRKVGYETIVGQRGSRLSGGQRQRVAIARALVSDPRILLLDEATSALDAVSENCVQDAIAACAGEKTIVIIAHRLSTIKTADFIVVMDKGGIAETGRYEDLMQKQGKFYGLQSERDLESNEICTPGDSNVSSETVDTKIARSINIGDASEAWSSTGLLPPGGTQHDSSISQSQQGVHSHKTSGAVWKFILDSNRETQFLATFGLVWAIISGSCSTVQAYLFANAVTSFSKNHDDDQDFTTNVDLWALLLVVLATVSLFASATRGSALAVCSEKFMIKARLTAFEHGNCTGGLGKSSRFAIRRGDIGIGQCVRASGSECNQQCRPRSYDYCRRPKVEHSSHGGLYLCD